MGHSLTKGRALFTRDKPARSDANASGPLSPAAGDGAQDEFPSSAEELQAGRDYVGDDETLHDVNPADLSTEPAHV